MSRIDRYRARRNRAAVLGGVFWILHAIAAGLGFVGLILAGLVVAGLILLVLVGLFAVWAVR